jgi:hypothetical protein
VIADLIREEIEALIDWGTVRAAGVKEEEKPRLAHWSGSKLGQGQNFIAHL